MFLNNNNDNNNNNNTNTNNNNNNNDNNIHTDHRYAYPSFSSCPPIAYRRPPTEPEITQIPYRSQLRLPSSKITHKFHGDRSYTYPSSKIT